MTSLFPGGNNEPMLVSDIDEVEDEVLEALSLKAIANGGKSSVDAHRNSAFARIKNVVESDDWLKN